MDKKAIKLQLPRVKASRDLKAFAVFFIVISILSVISFFLNFSCYRFMFQDLSKGVLVFRYVGSVIIRFAYIVLGFGLLYLKKWGRIGFIGMAVYHLLTFFLRHPYKPFFYAVVLAEHNLLGYVYPPGTCFENGYPIFPATAYFQQLSNVLLPLILQLSLILFEIFINVFIIWFLFKREIKKEFVASGDLNEFRI